MALLLLCSGIALAGEGDDPKGLADPEALATAPHDPLGPELEAKRTATSQTFLLPDGGRETRIYMAPVHFKDDDGEWKPIDERLKEAPGASLTSGANSFDVNLPGRLGVDPVRLSVGDDWIAQRLLETQTEPAQLLSDDAASYETADKGTSFDFSILSNGLKEDIEIAGLSEPSSFSFELSTSDGLAPELVEDGSIEFRGKDGKLVAVMPSPIVSDSETMPVSEPVRYVLEPMSPHWRLTVEVDREWLSQADRAWPATIDPTLELPSPALDCMFGGKTGQAGWRACGSEGRKELYTRYIPNLNASQDEWMRAALRFSPSSIPTTAYVSKATIGVHASSEALNTSGVELRPIYITNLWTSKLNWKTYDGVNNWQSGLEGGAYYGSQGEEILTSARGGAPGWWTFSSTLRAQAQAWVKQPSKNYGMLLKLRDDKTRECTEASCKERIIVFDSSAAADSSKRPYMNVTWYPAAPSTSTVTSPRQGAKTPRRLKLKSAWSGEEVTGVTYQYRVGSWDEGWVTIPPELVLDADGQPVSWPIPAQGKAAAAVYFNAEKAPLLESSLAGGEGRPQDFDVRALFDGPIGVAGYSKPVAAVLDPKIGSAHDAKAQVGPGSLDLVTGNFTISSGDVSIPTPNGSLEFARTNSARAWGPSIDSVLGWGWSPSVPVEASGGSAWRSATDFDIEEVGSYTVLTDMKGGELPFERVGENYVAPPELTGWSLTRLSATQIALGDPGGTRTTFEKNPSGSQYLPVSVTPPGSATNKTQMVYQFVNGAKRLKMIIAPSASGVTCDESNATTKLGCRALTFTYEPATKWGAPAGHKDRLAKVTYFGPASNTAMGQWDVSQYSYDANGQMTAQWDPRISPELKTTYTYTRAYGPVKTLTPPGEEPWTMEYSPETEKQEVWPGEFWDVPIKTGLRLVSVSRPSLLSSPSTAKTSIVYGVPVSGSGGPYDMSGTAVDKWNQQAIPTDATAIFPPDEVPSSSPPSSYARATVYYMEAEGQLVNTATPSGAGTAAASITTVEPDEHGNAVRELTAQNRLRALASEDSVKRSKELETKRLYSSDGTQMEEEWGPMHEVRLESGETVQARLHRTVQYNKDAPSPPAGTAPFHLPTRETTGASIVGKAEDADQRVSETKYDWTFRQANETIVDPQGLNLRTRILRNSDSGLPTEYRLPNEPEGKDARTTKVIYYTANGNPDYAKCGNVPAWANLPCLITPAAQPGATGQPDLKISVVSSYDQYGQPKELLEAPGLASYEAGGSIRKSVVTYDQAGRQLTAKREGGGVAIPKTQTIYSLTTGRPESQRFLCDGGCSGSRSHKFSFGSLGTGTGQFKHPADVARDAAGNLWVVDQTNNRVQKFNALGEYLSKFGFAGSGDGAFKRPTAIAIDPKGNLWVADSENHRIQKFNDKGQFLAKYGSYGTGNGQFNYPEGIAIDAKGNVFVSDTENGRVQKLSEGGAFIKAIGSKGSGSGQLGLPAAIDIGPNGDLWVADWGNNRVSVFDENGGFVRQFGSQGSGNGQFNRPDSIDVDSQGNAWVGEEADRVQRFDQNGAYVEQFGSSGSGSGQFKFSYAMGLTVDSEDNIWIADTDNNRIQKWIADDQAVTTTYDTLGRQTAYQDADGNTATTTYDLLGRPVTTNDGKGTQTRVYDSVTGLLTELQDSAAGTFTASYNADGAITEQGLPNGLVGKTTYDETGAPTHLSYEKMTMCSTNCTWLDFDAEESIHGQVLAQTSTLSSQQYSYDKAGRLRQARDTPQGGACTTRTYTLDKNSNRTLLATQPPLAGGGCNGAPGGGLTGYNYDAGDRLLAPGLSYDAYGRITSLPSQYAGTAGALTTSYFSNEMIASQSQEGITNTFQLDSIGRHRQRLQTGGLEGTEVFHYASGSDAPAWTVRGSKWSRNIAGIGGDLAAVQSSSSGTMLQLSNLHGDVVGVASLDPAAAKPTTTFEFDEFGNPKQGGTPRFGWLGGKNRRTELPSGVVQMGVRSYVPAMGRFLTMDPVQGGSATPYDYANADPVNTLDLDGNRARGKARLGQSRAVRIGGALPVQRLAYCACGGANVRVPEMFAPIAKKFGSFTAKVLAVGWDEMKKNFNAYKNVSELTWDKTKQAQQLVEKWEHAISPFKVPNLEGRITCTIGAGVELVAATVSEAALDSLVVGCLKGTAGAP